jgi:D-alanyl-D-alanine carboxypeptidase/D-alanyl-D-alanine-endopeptidase (penicillin-binding protein 4)
MIRVAAIGVALAAIVAAHAAEAGHEIDLIAAAGFASDSVGFVAVDRQTHAVLARHNADRPFIPASVAKIPTAAGALGVLSPTHRFETAILAAGEIEGGVLKGDLILRGGGDPHLSSDDLSAALDRLKTMGLARVDGRFVYDASALPELSEIESSQPEAAGYNAGLGGLNLNFNRVRLQWRRNGKDGPLAFDLLSIADRSRVRADWIPLTPATFSDFDPRVRYAYAGDADGERWQLSSRLPARGLTFLPLKRPAASAAAVFRVLARERGIELPVAEPGTLANDARLLHGIQSPPLAHIVEKTLFYSNNLAAEAIGLAASRRLEPSVVTLAESGAVLGRWLAARQSDGRWQGMVLANHSGLTTNSRLSPNQTAAILWSALSDSGLGDFQDLMSAKEWRDDGEADADGNGRSDIRLRAKSGTMGYARGLGGVLETKSGRSLVFSVYISDAVARAALDNAMDRRLVEMPPEVRSWIRRARKLEESLLRHWSGAY